MPSGSTALIVDGLSFGFGVDPLWEDLSIRVDAGSVHGVFGNNGSGKTTLFNVLSGFQRPSSGTVRYWDRLAALHSPLVISQLGRGLTRTFQVPAVVDNLTVEENLLLAQPARRESLAGVFWPENQCPVDLAENIEATISEFDLPAVRNTAVGTVSYGLRRLVGTLTAILSNAGLVLFDEPFANLSAENAQRLNERILREARNNGRSFLIIEHTPDHLVGLVDELHLLSGSVRTITNAAVMHEAMERFAVGLELP